MSMAEKTLKTFNEELYSKASVPGGGGAAALTGAIGCALGGMVANLTTGKKKYAAYEEDIQRILTDVKDLQEQLLSMIDQDAENFRPLAKAYSLPSETDEEKAYKQKTLEECTKTAVIVPVDIVRTAYKALAIQEELSVKGSALALSDVGVGVSCLRAAIEGGWLNIVINIAGYRGHDWADTIYDEIHPLVVEGCSKANQIYDQVEKALS